MAKTVVVVQPPGMIRKALKIWTRGNSQKQKNDLEGRFFSGSQARTELVGPPAKRSATARANKPRPIPGPWKMSPPIRIGPSRIQAPSV